IITSNRMELIQWINSSGTFQSMCQHWLQALLANITETPTPSPEQTFK
ncbi:13569_t:CDS:1, partial [Funneliformis caledonium]